MTDHPYLQLVIAALLPVVFAAVFHILEKKTAFGKLSYWPRQILIGIVFGGIAILGTEYGIPVEGAVVNCRDAAPLAAGLFFSGPAGIIAGLIGGVERWFAVYWGVGSFTRVACSVATICAGLFVAVLRRFMFEGKRPGWIVCGISGLVIEVFHMTMVYLTNMDSPAKATEILLSTTIPMVAANAGSVIVGAIVIKLLDREKRQKGKKPYIADRIQAGLALRLLVAFLITSVFFSVLQERVTFQHTENLFRSTASGVRMRLQTAEETTLRDTGITVIYDIGEGLDLKSVAQYQRVSELCLVNADGIVTGSNEQSYVGADLMRDPNAKAAMNAALSASEAFDKEPVSYFSGTPARYHLTMKNGDGYILLGFDSEQLLDRYESHLFDVAREYTIGKSGFVTLLDENFTVISSTEGDYPEISDSLYQKIGSADENAMFEINVGGDNYECLQTYDDGYRVVILQKNVEVYEQFNTALLANVFMEVLVFGILFVVIYRQLHYVILSKLKTVNRSLRKIAAGDLEEVVSVNSSREFEHLSEDINATVDTLKHYIAEAEARIDKELEIAREIQLSALPSTLPSEDGFDLYAATAPAKEVGGDFFDYYRTLGNELNFMIADVSGKGIPAAMFMMRAKTELKGLSEKQLPLSEVFGSGNSALCENNDAGMFVTAWQARLNLETGDFKYVNAGHNPPLVCRAGEKFAYLRSKPGFVLAGMDGVRYRESEERLGAGDKVFLYTDGVTEATNAQGELFGEDRLLAAVNECGEVSSEEICRHVRARVDEFVGDAPQFDDITMLAMRYFGTKQEGVD